MKSLDDLKNIRENTYKNMDVRNQEKGTRIVVGMATCGIAAGAKDVLNTIVSEVKSKGITDVEVVMTGCIGVCIMEPIVEVYSAESGKTTYVNIDTEKAKQIVDQHIINGTVVEELLIENN